MKLLDENHRLIAFTLLMTIALVACFIGMGKLLITHLTYCETGPTSLPGTAKFRQQPLRSNEKPIPTFRS